MDSWGTRRRKTLYPHLPELAVITAPLIRLDFLHPLEDASSPAELVTEAEGALLRVAGLTHPRIGSADAERLRILSALPTARRRRSFVDGATEFLVVCQEATEELARSGALLSAERLVVVYCDLVSVLLRLGDVPRAFRAVLRLRELSVHLEGSAVVASAHRMVALSALLVDEAATAECFLEAAAEGGTNLSPAQQLLEALLHTHRPELDDVVEEQVADAIRDARREGWDRCQNVREFVRRYHSRSRPEHFSRLELVLDRLGLTELPEAGVSWR
ncbi:MAG: hypothetical protein ACTHN3_05015 [Solirubrobacterales bacterium]